MKSLPQLGLVAVFVGIAVVASSAAQADVIDADAVISQAVVYPSSARITRTVKIELKEGAGSVQLKGVQPGFDENSLSVTGKGTASVRILGAGIKTDFIKDSPDARIKELETRLQAMDDDLAVMQGEAGTLEKKKAFLQSVQLFTGNQLPKDLVTKVPTADELKGTMSFIEGESKAYEDAHQALNIKTREKTREREVVQRELNDLQVSGGSRERKVLAVDLECEKPGDVMLEISYTVPQVGWYPLYDARVEFDKGKAVLSSYAVVHQTTGEDWNNVQLTLSTARPSVSGRMPELDTWTLRPRIVRQYRDDAMMMRGMAQKSMAAKFGSLGEKEMADAAPAMAAAAPVREEEVKIAYAGTESSGASLVYKAAKAVTVKSDGSEVRVPLNTQTLETAFEYTATPKLSPFAYLRSVVINDPKDQLLSGRVNVFLDGAYVGNSDIAKTIAPGEKFDLYLGVDEGVTVKRELLKEKSDDTLIGNIPSSTRKIEYTYKLAVENYKPRAITMKLFDNIPVSQDDKIKVVDIKTSLKPDTDKYLDHAGVELWTLVLQPKEKKVIIVSYTVEAPRDLIVEGL
ncbi:MAG: mucoidy inhibitor MuiA family protein [Candidatus Omnitrophica bacterium]|nr:mucoidy inhibitor MuiA family protein [Candidatus Omnitrophota bacterium]